MGHHLKAKGLIPNGNRPLIFVGVAGFEPTTPCSQYGHQNELYKIERRQKCCCGLFISKLNENGLSCEYKTKCDITLHRLYI